MMTGRDIVCFGDDWGRHPQVLEQPIRMLARGNRILWVNFLGHRSPRWKMRDLRRIWEKVHTAALPSRTPEPGITLVRPLGIPWHEFRWARRLNGWMLGLLLRRRMRRLGFRNVILITNSPVMVDVVGRLGEAVSVYYCLDDHAAFEGSVPTMSAIEEELLHKVDVAFFVSEELYRQKRVRPRHGGHAPAGQFRAVPESGWCRPACSAGRSHETPHRLCRAGGNGKLARPSARGRAGPPAS